MTNDINRAHLMEQGETGSADVARMIAEFYRTLKANKMPDSLARELTLDWANSLMKGIASK